MNLNDQRPDEDRELCSLTDDLDQIRSDTASFLRQRTPHVGRSMVHRLCNHLGGRFVLAEFRLAVVGRSCCGVGLPRIPATEPLVHISATGPDVQSHRTGKTEDQ